MSIGKIDPTISTIESIIKKTKSGDAVKEIEGQENLDKPKGFGDLLVKAVKDLNSMQLEADSKIEDMVVGRGNVTPHEAMIALEKADVAFQMMNQVRGKIVRAYEEVLRTQI